MRKDTEKRRVRAREIEETMEMREEDVFRAINNILQLSLTGIYFVDNAV